MTSMKHKKATIVVAVGDPLIHPEAMHIVAATGHPVLDVSSAEELRRVAGRGEAVVVDKHMAVELGGALAHPRVLFVAGDPGPIDWQLAFQLGADEGFVIPAQAPELLRTLGSTRAYPTQPGLSVGVVGAVGGCGASTFAVAVARSLGKGAVIIDADPTSGGLDLLLGAEHTVGARWNDLNLTNGQVNPEDLTDALPSDSGLAFLTVSRSRGAMHTLTSADVHAAVATLQQSPLVVDLSPRLPGWEEVIPSLGAVVVIVPAELRAVSAARALMDGIGASAVPMIRHRGWSGLSSAEMERLLGREPVGEIMHAPGLIKQSEMNGFASCPRQLKRAVALVVEQVS